MTLGSQPAEKDSYLFGKITLSLAFYLLVGKRKYCKVIGDSMLPLIKSGDFVIYKPIKGKYSAISIGDILVALSPINSNTLIIKRVSSISEEGFEVRGDNKKDSIDSRQFGIIQKSDIIGIVERMITGFK